MFMLNNMQLFNKTCKNKTNDVHTNKKCFMISLNLSRYFFKLQKHILKHYVLNLLQFHVTYFKKK